MEKPEMKKIFDKVKEHLRQAQKEEEWIGLYLEDISKEIEICEEDILLALANQAREGKLVEGDILICFSE